MRKAITLETAFGIVNDIHEGIDNGESKKTLRRCLELMSRHADRIHGELTSMRNEKIIRDFTELQEKVKKAEKRKKSQRKR